MVFIFGIYVCFSALYLHRKMWHLSCSFVLEQPISLLYGFSSLFYDIQWELKGISHVDLGGQRKAKVSFY